ncbi:methyl-accepting chemotaxis protein [Jeotgalibacillus sp. ET6]|uniref:methyl-accepting chemotaxis protein n=1 Tax=Jeotgalibacillus sp. ET6 TaxID=3037260 RepID=UPI0024184EF7|nr:methyl-accepting chemotaxis protein [Jeotgalibacillus sp. ET6]MDG5473312.1 methyl-accepting chemotaxis protein [Jeotgalibacillus sp. ET6]
MKKLKWKLLVYFLGVILLIIGLSGFTVFKVNEMNAHTKEMVDSDMAMLTLDQEKKYNISQQIALTRGYLLYGEQDYKERFLALSEQNDQISEQLQELSAGSDVSSVLTIARVWQDNVEQRVFSMYDSGREEEARVFFRSNYEPTARSLMDSLTTLSEEQQAKMDLAILENEAQAENMILTIVVVTSIVLAASFGLSMLAAHRITKPIRMVTSRMKAIARGQLPADPLIINSKDELGTLVNTVNEMNTQLRHLVSDINSVSSTVLSRGSMLSSHASEVREGSSQIASTMIELADGAGIQAESSSSLSHKITAFSNEISSSASLGEQARDTAEKTLVLTKEGAANMSETIQKVQDINHNFKLAMNRVEGLDSQTENISQLVQVIQQIADQTNLLALNAAIEAARAGEHGRGFAVVADEVRKLAEQVSSSISGITSIILTIQTESKEVVEVLKQGYGLVEEGTDQMEKTNQSFSSINDQVKQVSAEITTVANSLYDVVKRTNEINQNIEQIAAVSEEAAAGIEETSASAEDAYSTMQQVFETAKDLEQDAEQLNVHLSQFNVEQEIHTPVEEEEKSMSENEVEKAS